MPEKEKINEKKRARQRAVIKELVFVGIAMLLVAVLALLEYFLPFNRLLPATAIPVRQEGELRLHFLDVGQGDCTVVEFPSGNILVVDAGDGSYNGRNKLLRYLKGLKPASVTLLITHADIDHFGGMSCLLEAYEVEKVYLPVLASETEDYINFLAAVEKEDCKTETITRYGVIADDSGAYLSCLSPYKEGETNENDSSTVLYLNYGGVTAVLAGDISASRERRLVREYETDETLFDSKGYSVRLDGVDILKAAHHGSAASSSEEWLNLLRPSAFIVACGRDNSYGHPTQEALRNYRLAVPDGEIYRTDELGDIVVSIINGNYTATWQE